MNSSLQDLVNDRLGRKGPWPRYVADRRDKGMSWQGIADELRADARLAAGQVRGETLRRWDAAASAGPVKA